MAASEGLEGKVRPEAWLQGLKGLIGMAVCLLSLRGTGKGHGYLMVSDGDAKCGPRRGKELTGAWRRARTASLMWVCWLSFRSLQCADRRGDFQSGSHGDDLLLERGGEGLYRHQS